MSDGEGCKCWATCEGECTCGVDWTPKEVIDLRRERAKLIERLNDAETVIRAYQYAALEREKVLEYALERARYDLDGIGDYGRPLLSVERIDEALSRVKEMREVK